MNIAGYLTPMFNKTGVANEGRAKEIIENVGVEWRAIVAQYNRMIRGILQKYNTMVVGRPTRSTSRG